MSPVRHTTYEISFPMSTAPNPPPVPSAPVPVPVPVKRPWFLEILLPAAVVFLSLVMLYLGRTPPPAPAPNPAPIPSPWSPTPQPLPAPQPQPAPPPASASPLAQAAQGYMRGLPGTFRDIADQIRSGQIRTTDQAVALTRTRRQPFTDAQDQLFRANCDASGNITSPGPLADALEETARAMGDN